MTVDDAIRKSEELNAHGKYREDWFYYPGYHNYAKEWFVIRRPKRGSVSVAVFKNGQLSEFEK